MTPRFAITLNALAIYAISFVLLAAFYFQIVFGEPPCPLCLLQRIAFVALAVGPVMTLQLGPRPRHYAIALIAALIGAAIAGRQVLLHIMPDDPGFGSPLMGYHFYTWAFVCFAAAILAVAVVVMFDEQFERQPVVPVLSPFEKGAIVLVFAVTVLNIVSAFLECGFSTCPSDPVHYQLLGAAL